MSIGDSTFSGDVYYNDLYLAKYNAQGVLVWLKRMGCPTQDFIGNIGTDRQGNCFVTSNFSGVVSLGDTTLTAGSDYSPYNIFIAKYNPEGKRLWVKQLFVGTDTWLGDLAVDSQGNFYLTGSYQGGSFLAKYSHDGKLIWQKGIPATGHVAVGADSKIYLSGILFNRTTFGKKVFEGAYSSFICKFTNEGELMWANQLKGTDPVQSNAISVDLDGNTYVTGSFWGTFILGKDTVREVGSSSNLINHDIFIAKFDAAGKGIWAMRAGNRSLAISGKILVDENQSVYVSGHLNGEATFGNQSVKGGSFVARLDALGHIVWIKSAEGSYNGTFTFSQASSRLLYLTGSVQGTANFDCTLITSDNSLANHSDSFIASLLDTVPPKRPNAIRGMAYRDANSNCILDSGEQPLANIIIKAEPGEYYATTDTNGQYSLSLPAGQFTLSETLPAYKGHIITQICPSRDKNYSVTFTGTGNTKTDYDFGNRVTDSPLLQINLAADRRRRCRRNQTTVRYCNEGYASAQNVQVKVYYPAYVIPISANYAWHRQDSALTFDIGTLPPGACGTIQITDSVVCGNESIRGLTQCVRAVITPFNPRPSDARWDLSDLQIIGMNPRASPGPNKRNRPKGRGINQKRLKAVCKDNGFARLTIVNTGIGSMADSAAYRIYLDAVVVFEGQYKLTSGDSLSLQVPVNGRTLRLEADLRPYHPWIGSQPSLTLEGCTITSMTGISKGFVDQLPSDDTQDEVSVSCLQILDSYDPNDKLASPSGVGLQQIVDRETEIEYLVRFQNTGTDEAFQVVIKDSLDANLDISTLQIRAASHPFTWTITGSGTPVIMWTFDNIHLPDSSTNEAASHGYVRFRIRPKPKASVGSQFSNRAAITFDYNSPVLTNPVTNTIGQLPTEIPGPVAVDVCSGNYPTQADAGKDLLLDNSTTATLQGNIPRKGYGYWKLISGKGLFDNPGNPHTQVTGLGVGMNVLEWNIILCDTTSRSRITIERSVIPSPPQVSSPAPYCPKERILPLTAIGVNLRWYANKLLSVMVGEGKNFQPVFQQTDTLYVTQTVDGYQSPPSVAVVTILPWSPAPLVDSVGYLCRGTLIDPLIASGENIRWYSDSTQTRLLMGGNVFDLSGLSPGTLYAVQLMNGCASKITQVQLKSGNTNLNEAVFIPNVVTPNGDGYNDVFTRPAFEEGTCIETFQRITVHNRWGSTVFSSTDPYFEWNAQQQPTGLYFYEICYSNFLYKGNLTVLH